VRVALLASLVEGMGFGLLSAIPGGLAAPQAAHGWAQTLAFVSLFILAVGVHFLPRLRGAPLQRPRAARTGLVLFATGATLFPLLDGLLVLAPGLDGAPLRAALTLAALALPAGGILLALSMVETVRQGPPLNWRGGLTAILPLLVPAFAVLLLVVTANAWRCVSWLVTGVSPLPEAALIDALILGFALPVAVGFSARLLPIFLGVEVTRPALLVGVAFLLEVGALLWTLHAFIAGSALATLADALLAAGIVLQVGLAGVPFGTRRLVRRVDPPALIRATRPANLLIRVAHGWLLVTGLALAMNAVALASGYGQLWPDDAIRHGIGLGFVTLLIFGVGGRLLPGFASQKVLAAPAMWVVVIAASTAAALRIASADASALWATGWWSMVGISLAGVLLVVALGAFARHTWAMTRG
jgi:hypothetical protein